MIVTKVVVPNVFESGVAVGQFVAEPIIVSQAKEGYVSSKEKNRK